MTFRILKNTIDLAIAHSAWIAENKENLVEGSTSLVGRFRTRFPGTNTTASTNYSERQKYTNHEGYMLYNLFALAAGMPEFYNLYKVLLDVLSITIEDREFFMQAWINFQNNDEILDWHEHQGYRYHGYICIDPKKTITDFGEFIVENEPGLIVILKRSLRHKVVSQEMFSGSRITFGFDIIGIADGPVKNLGFIPIRQ